MMYSDDFAGLKAALISLGVPVGHGEGFKDEGAYIVWQEVGRLGNCADDRRVNDGWVVAVDYFTKAEYDDHAKALEAALDNACISFNDAAVDYEPDTGYTHYAYTVEVV